MPVFYSIQAFRDAIKRLTNKTKEGYSSVIKDICKSFTNKPIDEIRINRDMVLNEDNFTIIKLRVPNSGQKLSKKDGFRLIYLVHKQKEEVVFLYIYPKRGPQGLITLKEEQIILFLKNYINERKETMLISHKIENNLEEYSYSDEVITESITQEEEVEVQ